MQFADVYGLKKWDFDDLGDTSVCQYYDEMSAKNPKCSYFKKGGNICRGKNHIVNGAVKSGMIEAWMTGRTEMSQSQILTSIRTKLVAGDKAARQEGKIDACGCTMVTPSTPTTIRHFRKVDYRPIFTEVIFGRNQYGLPFPLCPPTSAPLLAVFRAALLAHK